MHNDDEKISLPAINDDYFIDHFDYFCDTEQKWKEGLYAQLPKTESEWLELFPEARNSIPAIILDWEETADAARKLVREALQLIDEKYQLEHRWFGRAVLKHTNSSLRGLVLAKRNIKRLKWLLPAQSGYQVSEWKNSLERARNVNIVDVANLYGLKLRKSGKNYQALCPFHHERTVSFYLYPPSRFVCFGCGEKGDVITLVQKLASCDFKEAVRRLAKI